MFANLSQYLIYKPFILVQMLYSTSNTNRYNKAASHNYVSDVWRSEMCSHHVLVVEQVHHT